MCEQGRLSESKRERERGDRKREKGWGEMRDGGGEREGETEREGGRDREGGREKERERERERESYVNRQISFFNN